MREYISMKELEVLTRGLGALASKVKEGHGWADVEEEAWKLYVKAEMMVAMLKLRLALERPGEFIKMVEKEPLTEHIIAAFSSVIQAREHARGGDYPQAFEALRDSRNNLRIFLEATRNLRLKRARAKTMSRSASSSPSPA